MAVPNLWRNKHQRYSLQGQVCPECSKTVFPPRQVCPYCQQAENPTLSLAAPEIAYTMPVPELKVALRK
jgi:hypothetical protein